MIVAGATTADGTPVWMLGLSAENVRRLQAAEPIEVPLPDDAGMRVLIFGGRGTEDDLRAQLAEYFEMPPDQEGTT